MSGMHAAQTVAELIIFSALIWCILNERRIAIWERKTFRKIKRRLMK